MRTNEFRIHKYSCRHPCGRTMEIHAFDFDDAEKASAAAWKIPATEVVVRYVKTIVSAKKEVAARWPQR